MLYFACFFTVIGDRAEVNSLCIGSNNFSEKYNQVLGNMRKLFFPNSAGTAASIESAMAEFSKRSSGVDSRTQTKLGSIQQAYVQNMTELDKEFKGKEE